MKFISLAILLLTSSLLFADDDVLANWKKIWPDLKEYDKNGTRLLLSPDLSPSFSLDEYTNLVVEIRKNGKTIVILNQDSNVELGTQMWIEQGLEESVALGHDICVPNNGSIYTNMRYMSFHRGTIVKKFSLVSDKYKEVEQPFYFLSEQSETGTDIQIYSDTDEQNSVATVQRGNIVDLLGLKRIHGEIWFLVRGRSGLVGWHKLEILGYDPSPSGGIERNSLKIFDGYKG